VTKVLVFIQKWPIFARLQSARSRQLAGEKAEKVGEDLREVGAGIGRIS
jgi:hypothetical protein